MPECEFSLICIFPYKDRIVDAVLMQEIWIRENHFLYVV